MPHSKTGCCDTILLFKNLWTVIIEMMTMAVDIIIDIIYWPVIMFENEKTKEKI